MLNSTHYQCNCTGSGFVGETCENEVNLQECTFIACFGNKTCDPSICDCRIINCEDVRKIE